MQRKEEITEWSIYFNIREETCLYFIKSVLLFCILTVMFTSCKKERTTNTSSKAHSLVDIRIRFKEFETMKKLEEKRIEEERELIEELKWEKTQYDFSFLPLDYKQISKNSSNWTALVDRGCYPEKLLLSLFPKNWEVSWNNFPTKDFYLKEENGGVHIVSATDEEFILTFKTIDTDCRDFKIRCVFSGKGVFRVLYTLFGEGKTSQSFSKTFYIFEQNQKIELLLKNEEKFKRMNISIRTKGDVFCKDIELIQTKKRWFDIKNK